MVKRTKKRAASGGKSLAFTVLLLLLSSCGIFSPRLSETPGVSGRVDPLNFSAIMDGTAQRFTKLRYEDLFRDDILYEDFNSGTRTKSQLIQRLQQIQIQDTMIRVQWKRGIIWTSADNDTIILSVLKYSIFPDGDTAVVPADSGYSNFTVVYDHDWQISQWKDVPERPASTGKSFFAPWRHGRGFAGQGGDSDMKSPGKKWGASRTGFLFRLRAVALLMATASLIGDCRNPFFPHLGTPHSGSPLRATPRGVITQLMNSYEQRSIDLFEDLFPASNTFRFYVSPSFVSTYQSEGKYYVNPPEPRDTLQQYIGAFPYYYYWTQDVEVQSHKRLFTQAQSIEFTYNPNVNPGDFRYIINGNGDTTNVEVLMTDGKIAVDLDMGGGNTEADEIWIDKQVFFLERDADNYWVIRKWYDFGSQP